MRTQQRLLKKQLLKAQDELVTAQGSIAKLCETIGSLQQAKTEREQEIAHLKVELQASRDVQSTMMKKMAAFEDETRRVKRNYA
uniref:Uncharacterized protein n=1 Tax=Globisporangium ultimum (strain ATCC 200006 / CBS 805.95 / DAOM BR144) TaxID=431595 RepID=K3WZB7_GLOUD